MRALFAVLGAWLVLAGCSDAPPGRGIALQGVTWVQWAGEGPRQVHGRFSESAPTAEGAARGFLGRHADELGLAAVDLVLEQERRGRAGTYLRFGQRLDGLPVFDGQVIVLVAGAAP